MKEGDKEFLNSLETQIEYFLCKREGIKTKDIQEFEFVFNSMKKEYPDLVGEMEAADHEHAPHNKQHLIAERLIRWLEDQMKLDEAKKV